MTWIQIIKHWRLIVATVSVLSALGYFAWQDRKINQLEKRLLQSQASIASYEQSLSELQADSTAKIQAVEAEKTSEIERVKTKERLLDRIEGANDEQDAPIAPVLRDLINGLYERSGDTGSSDQTDHSSQP
jgi:predicted negative regulator of RcsB-dependent stress response